LTRLKQKEATNLNIDELLNWHAFFLFLTNKLLWWQRIKKLKKIGILRIGMKDNVAQDQCNLTGKNKTIYMISFLKK
jgi:hypothetical protein